jgi:hypothetical protein
MVHIKQGRQLPALFSCESGMTLAIFTIIWLYLTCALTFYQRSYCPAEPFHHPLTEQKDIIAIKKKKKSSRKGNKGNKRSLFQGEYF